MDEQAMRWGVASDHAGFALKARVKDWLEARGFVVTDLGAHSEARTDYPDWGRAAAEAVAAGQVDRAVIVCGTGIGISIAANRHPGVRAALCHDEFTARMARAHNDANILALGARVVDEGMAEAIVGAFVTTDFEGGRHADRVARIDRT